MTIFGLASVVFICFCLGCAFGGYMRLRYAVSFAFSSWFEMLNRSLKKKYSMKAVFEHPLIVSSILDENNCLLREIDIVEAMQKFSWREFLKNCDETLLCLEQMELEMERRLRILTKFLEEKESELGLERRFFIERLEDIWAANNLLSFYNLSYISAAEEYNIQRNKLLLRLSRELFCFKELYLGGLS